MALGDICEHGSLLRSCEICERDAELAALRVENARLRKEQDDCEECGGSGSMVPMVGYDNSGREQFGDPVVCPACDGTGKSIVADLRTRLRACEAALERCSDDVDRADDLSEARCDISNAYESYFSQYTALEASDGKPA